MVNNWLNIIQEYLIPPTCILCGNVGFNSQDICHACFKDIRRNIDCCYRCAETFETANKIPQLCGQCISQTPFFDDTYAPFLHQGIIRFLIASLKFNRQYKNARLLGYLLASHLEKNAEMPELIIPIPLHPQRYRERRFNQSIEIAKTVSKQFNIPIDTKSCIRNRNTTHQTELPAKQRHINIKNAFQIIKQIDTHHIAILDDVMTTGSTANEMAKVLKKAGVTRVDIWVCARA
ncbi:MAG: ComF family protein [Methylococcales bacterium]|nr:ComF family protein [Methylococcales bacterium]